MRMLQAGIALIIFTFIIALCYFFLSPFFDSYMDSMESIEGTGSEQIAQHASNYRTVFNMFFAGTIIAGIIFFIMWSHHRDPGWSFFRRF